MLDRQEINKDRLDRERNDYRFNNPLIDRSERKLESTKAMEGSEKREASLVAKLVGLGFGAYLVGKVVPKDLMIDALHKMGTYGSETFRSFINSRNSYLAQLNKSPTISRLSPQRERGVQLLDFIENEANPMMQNINASLVSRSARDKAREETRLLLLERFSSTTKATNKYVGLTIGDLKQLYNSNQNSFNTISASSFQTLVNFGRKIDPNSTWYDNLILDSHLLRDANSNAIRDIRWSSLSNINKSLVNGLGFQIPFTNFRPLDLFQPLIKLFSKQQGISVVGRNQTVAEGIKTPRFGISYIINGKLFNFSSKGAIRIGGNRKFRSHDIDAIAKANLARLGEHPLQKVAPGTGIYDRFQTLIGIGPKYREEAAGASRLVYRHRVTQGLKNNSVVWKPRKNLRVKDLSAYEQAKVQARSATNISGRDLVVNPFKNFKDMPFIERQKALLGMSTFGDFTDVSGNVISKRPGLFSISSNRPTSIHYGRYRVNNRNIDTGHTVLEDKLSTKLHTVARFATTRLNQLIGATLGIGFRPSIGRFSTLKDAAKIAGIGILFNPMNGLFVEAAKYVNYLFEKVTSGFGLFGKGVGIDDIAIKGYEASTLGLSALKDITGITSVSKYLENLFPGSIESPLSGLIRSFGFYKLGSAFNSPALGLALAAGSGSISDIFGTNLLGSKATTTSSELYDLYYGDKKERIRNNRWWMLGRQSFYGEGTDRFEYNWVKLFKSDYEYTDALYGSKGEYFTHASPLPTPHNLFLLASDEDYFGRKHAQSRPYHQLPSGELINQGNEIVKSNNNQYLTDAGFAPREEVYQEPGSQTDLGFKLKSGFDSVTEMLGIYKFIGESLFGRMETGPVLGNASSITDIDRLYWDKDLGGLFGHTELLRRYILPPNSIGASEYVNQIQNQMPSFLPGQGSMFNQDRENYIDFTVGDPYAKIKGGEYRLPGAGYEALNELHSGEKGTYSPVDALLILSDVAPTSQAYRYYDKIVQNLPLEEKWRARIEQAKEERAIKLQGFAYDFRSRRSDTLDKLAGINEDIKYNAVEKTLMNQYDNLTLGLLPEVGRIVPFGTILTHKLFPHHTAEQDYLERIVYDSRRSNWDSPYESFIRPKALTLYNENPLTASLGGAMLGLLSTNPTTRLVASSLGAAGFGAASTYRAIKYDSLEGGYIPDFRREEEAFNSYFDKLEYLRLENAERSANELGNTRTASYYRKQKNRTTMVGLDYSNTESLLQARSAIPRQERSYFDSFANAPESVQQDILRMSPEYMRNIYQNIWEPGSVEYNRDEELERFTSRNTLPDEEWAGWNPGVEKWQLMSRAVDTADNSVAVDMHRMFVSTAMMKKNRIDNQDIFLDIDEGIQNEISGWHEASARRIEIEKQLRDRYQNANVRMNQSGGPGNRYSAGFNIRSDRRQEIQDMIDRELR